MNQTSPPTENKQNPTFKIFLGIIGILFVFILSVNQYNQPDTRKTASSNFSKTPQKTVPNNAASTSNNRLKEINQQGADLLEKGQLQEALEVFTKASQDFSTSPEPFHNMGIVYGKLKDWKNAIRYHEKALALKPDFAAAHYSLGITYQSIQEKQKAIKAFENLLEVSPKDKKAHLHLGILYDEQEQFNTALTHYRQAIAADPQYYTAYYNIGNTFLTMQQLDSAATYYEGAIKIKPDYAKAYVNLANVLNQKGEKEKAQTYFRKALELDETLQNRVRK